MGLINLLLKASILLLDLRDTYDALDTVKLDEIGRNERQVLIRNAEDGTKQTTTRRRVGTSKRKAAVKSALTTVLVWNLFHKIEPVCDRTIAWFVPFYDSFKTLFLIWMLFTRSYGASILVYRFLAPLIKPYESIIDGLVGLTLALFGWIATLVAPFTDRCATFIRVITSTAPRPVEPVVTKAASTRVSTSSENADAPAKPSSTAPTGGRTTKMPPPPPSEAIKASPSSVTSIPYAAPQLQPRANTLRPTQGPVKKASQSNLAATRRVLQELPVPRHAFDTLPPPATSTSAGPSPPASNGAAASTVATPTRSNGGIRSATVKAEPSESSLGTPQASPSTRKPIDLGPPPTPPTGLRNYAFIPGQTPQRSGGSSLISPTPRFPGGFSFSFAAPQASAFISGNPFQAQSRVPLTAQMAPLSLSSQSATPANPSGVVGVNAGAASSTLTHDKVPSAHDTRIVPPPNGAASIIKVSSSRSLRGKATTILAQAGAKASMSSSSKKRSRSAVDNEEGADEAGQPKSASRSPRKRAKPAAGKATASKIAPGNATARARAKAKQTADTWPAATTVEKAVPRRKAVAANGMQRAAKQVVVSELDGARTKENTTSMAVDQIPPRRVTSSPRKKAASATSKSTAISSKSTAQRTTAKKTSSTSKARSESVEVAETSEPPQRLTRSRTKQNLSG
ncbi:uncharacterized protein UTRI_01068_B [Ustilago trichophora]|uniref:Uncharacterized protein n=1 Tax=Ustilago trichophora TaxID=86804 RepID=A0A5C3DT32_9BASI|nr:uncharacterized protein UTRI_01068_B [Ustilago trichophora]